MNLGAVTSGSVSDPDADAQQMSPGAVSSGNISYPDGECKGEWEGSR